MAGTARHVSRASDDRHASSQTGVSESALVFDERVKIVAIRWQRAGSDLLTLNDRRGSYPPHARGSTDRQLAEACNKLTPRLTGSSWIRTVNMEKDINRMRLGR